MSPRIVFAALALPLAAAAAAAVLSPAPARAAPDPAPLRVGLSGQYPPFNTFTPEGELTGFDVDFARQVCAKLARPCEFVIIAWDGILSALLAGRVDTVIGSMAVTEERARQVDFSAPYYASGAQLFLREPASAPADLAGVRLGLTLGTTYGSYARRAFPKAELRYYKGDIEALQDLEAGRIEGLLTDRLVGLHMRRAYGVAMEPRGPLLYVEQMAIPVAPGHRALLAAINRAISDIRAGAAYAELFERYFGQGALDPADGETYRWSTMLPLMLSALGDTLEISAVGLTLGLLLAILLAAGLLGLPRPVALVLALWVDFIRATPFLVQLFALYFGLPAMGVDLSAWHAATLGIALHSSAYLAELFKVAFQAVPIGQRHAARTLGLTRWEALRHVVVPQMLPLLAVPVINTVVAMIKDSSIVSVISVHELTMQTQQLISATFMPMELYLAAAALYFAVTWPLLLGGRALERRYRKQGLLHA